MNTALPFIAILLKPHTALRRLAVQPRTVFGGTPCMRLYEYRYTYSTSAQAYVNHPGIGCALAHRRCVKHAAFMVKPRWLPPPQPSPAAGFALRGRASFCGISDFHPHNKHSAYTLAHRRLPNCPTIARSPTALLPLPVGLKQLARSATSICSRSERKGWGEGSQKSSVASTIDLYRDHFTCPNNTEHTARNPTPAHPHRGRESFRCPSAFRALNNP